jgi:cytochrome c oxidase cbb3-type subunit 3
VLYGTVAFSMAYWLYYEAFAIGANPLQSYSSERMERMNRGGAVREADLVALAADRFTVAAGRQTFVKNCVACHGDDAAGKIGPNLTDEYWIRGGAPVQIYETVLQGSPAKGMPAWGPSLGAGAVKQLTAFLLSIRNSNVSGKPPQGQPWRPAAAAAAPASDRPAPAPATGLPPDARAAVTSARGRTP